MDGRQGEHEVSVKQQMRRDEGAQPGGSNPQQIFPFSSKEFNEAKEADQEPLVGPARRIGHQSATNQNGNAQVITANAHR